MLNILEGYDMKALGFGSPDATHLLAEVLRIAFADRAIGTADPAFVLRLQVSAEGRRWSLVRLAPFPTAVTYLVGPMCCTPERAGLEVLFSSFELGTPLNKDLDDLS
jgi:uncharacterized protein